MSTLDKMQFDNLLIQVVEQGASDLYLTMGSSPIVKVGEQLLSVDQEVLTSVKIEELVFSLINDEQKKILEKEKSLVFSHTFDNKLRFRINIFYQKGSLAASLRLIPNEIKGLEELGLPEQIKKIINLEGGLVVVSGINNSGKSTSMAAIVDYFNKNKELRIVTLEKPIEYIYSNKKSIIQQREIGKDTPSFEEGLEDCFGGSLDVIVVSQVETKQEMEKILDLAQQGYLVLTVMNASSTLGVILKILSMFDGEEQDRTRKVLSEVLRAIICQKLLINKQGKHVMLPEILFNNEAIRLSIADNKLNQINNILDTSAAEGMVSFKHSLAELVSKGEISDKQKMNNQHIKNLDNQDI